MRSGIISAFKNLKRKLKIQRKTLIILINLVIYSLTSTVVVLEEMFRETLQTLACLSVLSGTYSLHMTTRDSYRNPLNGISLVHLNDEQIHQTQIPQPHGGGVDSFGTVHELSSNLKANHPDRQTQKHLMAPTTKNTKSNVDDISLFEENNEIPDYPSLMSHEPTGPLIQPRGLQELFNGNTATNKYDIRQQQQQHQQTQQQQHSSNKRSGVSAAQSLPPIPHGLASQLMLRSARGTRQYDVPQIECPPAMDGMERFACPSPDRQGRYRCIDDHVLCDGFIDCPGREDEDRQACMFYKTTKAHLDVLADALLRWARGR
uniref:CSON005883 protein n=1 Tax=Culicoides sonorensis TaxID=179676 RepID=A0A336KAK1_CULSO